MKHAAIAAFDKGALAGAVIIFGGVVVVVVTATKFAVIVDYYTQVLFKMV